MSISLVICLLFPALTVMLVLHVLCSLNVSVRSASLVELNALNPPSTKCSLLGATHEPVPCV